MKTYQGRFLIALLLALVVETLVSFPVARNLFKQRNLGLFRIAFAVFTANLSSLPYLWFVAPAFLKNRLAVGIVGEAGVVLWEAGFYAVFLPLSFPKATLLSFLANLASFLLGLLVFG